MYSTDFIPKVLKHLKICGFEKNKNRVSDITSIGSIDVKSLQCVTEYSFMF
jgi:hypothetical protein